MGIPQTSAHVARTRGAWFLDTDAPNGHWIGPFTSAVEAIRTLLARTRGVRMQAMSDEWLAEHEFRAAKHRDAGVCW